MTKILRLIASSLAGFLLAGLIAYFAGRLLADPEPPSIPAPTGSAVNVVIPEPIGFDEDPIEAAMERAARVEAVAFGADEADIAIEAVPTAETAVFAGEDLTDLIFGEDGVPLAIPGLPLPGAAVLEDLCIGSESVGCPFGIPGTVSAFRSVPPLHGVLDADPAFPRTSHPPYIPECPNEGLRPAGSAVVGVSSNGPATITIEVWPYSAIGVVAGGVTPITIASHPDDVADWNAWLDEEAGFDDPRYYIDHCVDLVGLEPGPYFGRAALAPLGGEVAYVTDPIIFEIRRDGDRYRRPTALLGFGLDVLHVGVTRTPDQDFVLRAYPTFERPVGCPATVEEDDETRPWFSRVTGFVPPDVLADPGYPYLLEHSITENHALTLQEGQRFFLCLYWMNGTNVELSEQIDLSTPNGYSPEVRLLGFANLVDTFDDFVIDTSTPHGCIDREHVRFSDLPQADSPTPFDPRSDPSFLRHEVTLCDDLRPLALADQYGVRLEMALIAESGESYDSTAVIPLALACDRAACAARPPELAIVPLPDVPVERRLCGSGRGAGCDSESPTRSAGQAVLEIRYDEGTRLAGYPGWTFGSRHSVNPSPDAVEVSVDLRTATSTSEGAAASIEADISSPTPVRVRVAARDDDGTPPCVTFDLGEGAALVTLPDEPGTDYALTVGGLCTGSRYLVTFSEFEPSGAAVEFVDGDGASLAGGTEVWTAFPRMTLRASLSLDIGGRRRVLQSTPISVTAIGTDDTRLAAVPWNPTAEDFANNLETDWRYTPGSACKLSDRVLGPLHLTTRQTIPVSSESIRVQLDLDMRHIGSGGRGGRLGTNCTPGRLDKTYRIDLLTDIPSLIEGVDFVSSDGVFVFYVGLLPE